MPIRKYTPINPQSIRQLVLIAMPNQIRFVLALHNHQPIGNFDHVFEQAYQDSYLPFLDWFSRYELLKISLHTSGSLMEWIDERHPEYLDRLAELVDQGRIEILGGPYFEPILSMIPSRDRIGQIRRYTRWLENRLGTTVRGMWVPERVWEQSFTRDLVDAGIQYTVLDDFHFKHAGLTDSQLLGRYMTEDDGRVMSIFPGSERLRYAIPFEDPRNTIDHLSQIAEQAPNAIVVFSDDGEKFGTWPGTHKYVYEEGWLDKFFTTLVENRDWIHVTTLSESFDHVDALGKIYLPDCSYREMTEWALPAEQQLDLERIHHDLEHDERLKEMDRFVRGGFWRNFKVRYPESDEMYARMMSVSSRLREAERNGADVQLVEQARTELYRGQCNCSYWHGAFGGIYLPHLRNAVFEHLIAADNLLDQAGGRPEKWVDAVGEDFNFDSLREIQLANDRLIALIEPHNGGHLYELDVRAIRHNLLATLTRQPEAYHEKVRAGNKQENGDCSSIHDIVVFKQEGLDQRVQYDAYPRKSLVDLFYAEGTTLESVVSGQADQQGDFIQGDYEAHVRSKKERIQIKLVRQGRAFGLPIKITKGITLNAGSSTLEIAYMLEDLPQNRPMHFAVEFNFAGMPAGADDRYFHSNDNDRIRHGQLGTQLDLSNTHSLGLVDEWLGIDVGLISSLPAGFWAFPIETVSNSESGFELVHQSVVVQPHWIVRADQHGRWSVKLELSLDTRLVESRREESAIVATT